MKLGVNLWTVYGWEPAETVNEAVLQALAAMGSQGIELVVDEAHHTAEILLGRNALPQRIKDLGLEVPSIGSVLFWRYNLASQNEELRQRGLETIRVGCRVAQAFGARVLLVLAGQQEPRTEYTRSYDTAISTLRQAAHYAREAGITLGVENVPGNFLCSPDEYARFIRDVNDPTVQAYLDFANGSMIGNSPPENWITAVKGHIAMVHAKDYDPTCRSFVCCGQGDLNWQVIFTTLREVGYDGYLIVETPPKNGHSPIQWRAGLHAAQMSLVWLQQFI
ncbi:MAG: sugar phosphate isomerase/epimerase family protein [Anaerolineae bacterium]